MATSSQKKSPPENITWHASRLSRPDRWGSLSTTGATVWFTGLSGSGKSTLAAAVELELVRSGRAAYRLDGDNLRTGLNSDLDFTRDGREENVRRVSEVAYLFADSGVVALVALISPYRSAREHARRIHESSGVPFIEVHMTADVDVCASRDPKGLYARANAGSIASFTGLDDPYEPPESPELALRPDMELKSSVDTVIGCLDSRIASLGS